MLNRTSKSMKCLIYTVLIVGIFVIIAPMVVVVFNAFKGDMEIASNWFAPPSSMYLDNFKRLFENNNVYISLFNSLIITISALIVTTLIIPLAAYGVSRRMVTNKWFRFLYYFLIVGLFVPFQVKMVPLIMVASKLHMMNVFGIIVVYISSATCEGVFLCAGYLQTLPSDLEEAAYIDGAGYWGTYWKIVFPLMKPIIATVAIQNALWIWNDFQLPLLMLNKSSKFWTLILYVYNFKTAYSTDYGAIFASFLVSMMPIMIFYAVMQKKIIGGLTSGAVKG